MLRKLIHSIYGGEDWYIAAEKAGVHPLVWMWQDVYTWLWGDVFGPWLD